MKPARSTDDRVSTGLLKDIRSLIESARSQVVRTVNSSLVMLHWRIGTRIRKDILGEERAKYGQQIVTSLSRQLVKEYGAGWEEKHLWHCLRSA